MLILQETVVKFQRHPKRVLLFLILAKTKMILCCVQKCPKEIFSHTHQLINTVNLSQYEGEITVLYQATVIPGLTNKKWATKELPVKAGEALDVIAKATDNRLICRNEEGKCENQASYLKDTDA